MELSQRIDPNECLRQQHTFAGSITSDQLTRVSDQLSSGGQIIPYTITFQQDEQGRCIVHCSITTCLNVICQRCGQPMQLPVTIASQLCVIADDKMADKLPKHYEPLVAEDGMIALIDVIEEELLLAIPMIPRHDIMECPVNLSDDLLH